MDIRWPIGLLFLILGVLLLSWGLAGPALPAVGTVALNINAWWGAVLAAFGAVMVALAWLARV